jgi:integrase
MLTEMERTGYTDAAKNELVSRNVARLKSPPKVSDTGDEMVIVHDVPALVEKLEGSALRLSALLGRLCGMRLGEILALRWERVGLDGKVIQVRKALEQTKTHGIRFKAAKTRAWPPRHHCARWCPRRAAGLPPRPT